MDFTFFSPYGQPLDTSDIAQIERELGAGLPADYTKFLMTHGGGDIIGQTSITFQGISNDVLVLFGKDGPLNLDFGSEDIRLGDAQSHYPEKSLIIGDDLGGNSYFACWNNDKFSIRWMGYLKEADHFHVAETFTEFLEKINVTGH